MPIEEINNKTIKTITGEAQLALTSVLKKYGIDVAYEGGKYTADQLTAKFVFSIPRQDGIPTSFATNCERYGLTVSDFGRKFTSNSSGEFYKLTGFRPRNRKYPIIGERLSDGKSFKFVVRVLRNFVGN